jgi:hypothetical protein
MFFGLYSLEKQKMGVKCRLDGEHYTLPKSAIPCSYDFDPYMGAGKWACFLMGR